MNEEERARYERQIFAREQLAELMQKDPTVSGVIVEATYLLTVYVNKYPNWLVNEQALIWSKRATKVLEEINESTWPPQELLDDDPQW